MEWTISQLVDGSQPWPYARWIAQVYWELIAPAYHDSCPPPEGWAGVVTCRLEGLTIQDWAAIFLQPTLPVPLWPGWPW